MQNVDLGYLMSPGRAGVRRLGTALVDDPVLQCVTSLQLKLHLVLDAYIRCKSERAEQSQLAMPGLRNLFGLAFSQ